MITQEKVRELFEYRDGNLIRKITTSSRAQVGDIAGCIGCRGYKTTGIGGKAYLIHRIIWLWHHGYIPENDIDHIDCNKLNNHIENLREGSHRCNMRNRKQQKSFSGIKGIYQDKTKNKWTASIMINRKRIHFGCHHDLLEAACHRLAAEQCVNWAGCDKTSPAYLFVKRHIDIK